MENYTHNLLIVSDLHLSEGFSVDEGKFSSLEDFFSDQSFADFLTYYNENREKDRPWRLIIAGDLFDFLQVTAVPANSPEELWNKLNSCPDHMPSANGAVGQKNLHNRLTDLMGWIQQVQELLQQKDAQQTETQQLQKCINWLHDKSNSNNLQGTDVWALERFVMETWILANTDNNKLTKRTKNFGLGTSWQETVWKLDHIAVGHPVFFQALGQFVAEDNELIVLSGNHDIELCWKEVQERLTQLLTDAADAESININFLPWVYYERGVLYLEHGQQYEGANAFENILNPTVPGQENLIEFPPGSMLVRYLFNKIEEAYPFADNLRPLTRFFSWAFQNEFIKLVTIMVRYVGGLYTFVATFIRRSLMYSFQHRNVRIKFDRSVKSFPEMPTGLSEGVLTEIDGAARDIRQSKFSTIFILFIAGALVLAFLGIVFAPLIILLVASVTSLILKIGLPLFSAIGGFAFKQLVAPKILGLLSGQNYLEKAANHVVTILQRHNEPRPRLIVFGHNHDPDLVKVGDKQPDSWYVNTGSWLYHQDVVEEWLQQTKYQSFLKIIPDNIGASPELRFWNSYTSSPEQIRLRAASHKNKRK